jgi:seryl-tRNA synthetase
VSSHAVPRSSLRRDLFASGLLVETGVDGVYGRSGRFEAIVAAFDDLARQRFSSPDGEVLRFPPVVPRNLLERAGYLASFPHLLGSVHSFAGDDKDHAVLLGAVAGGADWTAGLPGNGVALAATACHPVYQLCASGVADAGRRFDVSGWCYRHEPSPDPARFQAFRMHEWVVVGSAETASAQRERWVLEAGDLLRALGLPVEAVVANDPFFGRGGRLLAAGQRDEGLKFELVTVIADGEPVAVASCNRHLDHFGTSFGISLPSGDAAHSACVGFGLERVALALLARHGLDADSWPSVVRGALWP